ncbi:hypothetical protein [Leptolyngbya ohadii]|uniref:hypothetical protein n=1 Tax=Leptolyngbya ohadii TaxID=1962290 RepID=UPI000B59F249|nr:hypothetical protein [Leptolyngbya ohadii]
MSKVRQDDSGFSQQALWQPFTKLSREWNSSASKKDSPKNLLRLIPLIAWDLEPLIQIKASPLAGKLAVLGGDNPIPAAHQETKVQINPYA